MEHKDRKSMVDDLFDQHSKLTFKEIIDQLKLELPDTFDRLKAMREKILGVCKNTVGDNDGKYTGSTIK